MNEELLKKLRFKGGQAAVFNAPDGYDLGLNAGGAPEDGDGAYDFALLYVNSANEAEQWIPRVIGRLNDDSVFWICYPKQTPKSKTKPDVNRDILAAWVQNKTPYRVVSNVAVDESWSALRVRPQEPVKAGK